MPDLILRFINSSGFVSHAIDFVEGGSGLIDHVEMGTPEETWIGARADGGVQERPSDYCTPTLELVYTIPISADIYAKTMGFLRSQIGKSYDFSDIGGILLHSNWHTPDRWICSQLVCAACEEGGLFLLNVLPGFTHYITPEMLHLSPLLIGHLTKRASKY